MYKHFYVMFNDYDNYLYVVLNGMLLLRFLETYEITVALVTHDRIYFANTRVLAKFCGKPLLRRPGYIVILDVQ